MLFGNARRLLRIREAGVRTTATITQIAETGVRRGEGKHSVELFTVRWSFADRNEQIHEGGSFLRDETDARAWAIGEAIIVYYDPERPDRSLWEADIGPRKR